MTTAPTDSDFTLTADAVGIGSTALFAFYRDVMVRLGHHGWTLECRGGSDSFCWRSQRKITLGLGYNGDPRQILLHEIAHIDTCRFSNNKHTPAFWERCENLTRRFLKAGLDQHQKRHREFASEGIYALRYANDQDHRPLPESAVTTQK